MRLNLALSRIWFLNLISYRYHPLRHFPQFIIRRLSQLTFKSVHPSSLQRFRGRGWQRYQQTIELVLRLSMSLSYPTNLQPFLACCRSRGHNQIREIPWQSVKNIFCLISTRRSYTCCMVKKPASVTSCTALRGLHMTMLLAGRRTTGKCTYCTSCLSSMQLCQAVSDTPRAANNTNLC